MESALKLSALVQPFGVADAIKSWFGLLNLFLEANQIIVSYNLHALTFSDIATSRELFKHHLQIITPSRSNILSSGTLEVIPSPKSAIKQEFRRAYRRKRFARDPPAVEPRSITPPSSSFTD